MDKRLLSLAGNLENYGKIKNYTKKITHKNNICGDKITLYLQIKKKILANVTFECESCLICQVSTMFFCHHITNKSIQKIKNFSRIFIHDFNNKILKTSIEWKKFSIFKYQKYINRKDCILMPFNAFIKSF